MRIMVLNGPNLSALGQREPDIYGEKSLAEINRELAELAEELGVEVEFVQTESEGEMIEQVHRAGREFDALIINPGALSHTSLALLDALLSVKIPKVEVHLTNPLAREPHRRRMLSARAADHLIAGLGDEGYRVALASLSGKQREERDQ